MDTSERMFTCNGKKQRERDIKHLNEGVCGGELGNIQHDGEVKLAEYDKQNYL